MTYTFYQWALHSKKVNQKTNNPNASVSHFYKFTEKQGRIGNNPSFPSASSAKQRTKFSENHWKFHLKGLLTAI